jgi:pimeloyl-ACP methyl ester carboxylesterase
MRKKNKSELKSHSPNSEFSGQKIPMRDGTEIFVRIIKKKEANGIPIILNDGLGCDGYAWKYLVEYFQNHHSIVHWHYRGHGKSDVPQNLNTISMKTFSRDLKTILDHFYIDQAVFCGHSMGVQLILEAYSLMPERFAALALVCGGYQYPLETWHASLERDGKKTLLNQGMKRLFPKVARSLIAHSPLWQPLWKHLMASEFSYKTALRYEVNSKRIARNDLFPYFEHLSKMEARVFAQTANSFIKHNARHVLSKIKKPTLIVAGGSDTFSPPWLSVEMHKAIPKSDLLYISDGTHCTPIEHPELINLRLEKFLHERLPTLSATKPGNFINKGCILKDIV